MDCPTTDIRVGSATTVVAVRSGAKVTVSPRVNCYWTSRHAFGTWGAATGIIEYCVPGTTTWHGLKNVSADNYGRYSYSYSYTVSSRRESGDHVQRALHLGQHSSDDP